MNHELYAISSVVFGILAVLMSGLYTLVGRVGHYEIKRKAQLHQPGARTLYVLHQRGYEPLIGLAIWQMLFTALFIICLIKVLPVLLSVFVATTVLTLGSEMLASFYMQKFLRRRLDLIWKVLGKMLSVVRPLSVPPARVLQKRFGHEKPTIYSREHLLAILEAHGDSKISDVDRKEIQLIEAALEFPTKQVRSSMIMVDEFPRISRDASVGPVLLDELHASGFTWFPVHEVKQNHIVGVVSLYDLARMRSGGSVSSKLREDVSFVNEEAPLMELIDVYKKTHETVFLVTNRFDDVVGLVLLEQILNQLFGVDASSENLETVVE